MKTTTMMVAVGLLIAACGGSKLDGTYTDEMGVTSYRFTSGGKVYVSVMGIETELNYEVDGNKVKIGAPQGGNLIFTLLADGGLSGPMGVRLVRGSTGTRTATATRDRAPAPRRSGTDYAERSILASMRSDLRNLVTAEEAYFGDHVKYTTNLEQLRRYWDPFKLGPGNAMPQITLVGSGWTATIRNPNTRQLCAMFIGTATPIPPATEEGIPACG